MPKLNTLLAATLVATTMITPVNAGEPGPVYTGNVHPGGYQSGPSYSGSTSATSSAYAGRYGATASSYSSASASSYGGAYANSSAQAGLPNFEINTNGPVDVIGDQIVCMMGTQEVPCDTVPGLAEALRLQGMNSIADQIPAYRGPAPGNQIMAYNSAGYTGAASGTMAYAGGGYAPAGYASSSAYAGSTGYTSSSYASAQASSSVSTTGSSRYYAPAPVGSPYYPQPAPSYGHGSEVWVTPCGQVVTRRVVHTPPPCAAPVRYVPPAPVSIRLTDGTVYALNGGVGKGIYGEFYGGGGAYIDGGARYSGVLSASASRFTFRTPRIERPHPTPKPRYPTPKPRHPKPKTRYPGGGKGGWGH